jgi:hypothetical protein
MRRRSLRFGVMPAILAGIFGAICGDDHRYIVRSVLGRTSELVTQLMAGAGTAVAGVWLHLPVVRAGGGSDPWVFEQRGCSLG